MLSCCASLRRDAAYHTVHVPLFPGSIQCQRRVDLLESTLCQPTLLLWRHRPSCCRASSCVSRLAQNQSPTAHSGGSCQMAPHQLPRHRCSHSRLRRSLCRCRRRCLRNVLGHVSRTSSTLRYLWKSSMRKGFLQTSGVPPSARRISNFFFLQSRRSFVFLLSAGHPLCSLGLCLLQRCDCMQKEWWRSNVRWSSSKLHSAPHGWHHMYRKWCVEEAILYIRCCLSLTMQCTLPP